MSSSSMFAGVHQESPKLRLWVRLIIVGRVGWDNDDISRCDRYGEAWAMSRMGNASPPTSAAFCQSLWNRTANQAVTPLVADMHEESQRQRRNKQPEAAQFLDHGTRCHHQNAFISP